MKKIIVFLLFAVCCHAADKKAYFGYGNVHMMGGYPMVGVGLRSIAGINGYEIAGSLFPYFHDVTHIMFHTKALYLFRPGGKNFYAGAGLGLLREVELLRQVSGSYEASLGFEWHTRHAHVFFLEADAISPFAKGTRRVVEDGTVVRKRSRMIWPGITFGFGF